MNELRSPRGSLSTEGRSHPGMPRESMTDKSGNDNSPSTKGFRIRWPRLYDFANRLQFMGREEAFRNWTIEIARISRGESVLDVGCGTGNLTMAAKKQTGAEGEVHGIDAAREMIERASRKAGEKKLDISYQTGLIEELPFSDDAFDVALSSLMLHHLPKDLKRRGIAEIGRVLRPGGRFVAVDIDPPLMYNIEITFEALKANGFTAIQLGRTPFRTMFLRIHYLNATLER